MAVDFDSFRYFPTLRTRMWEMRGLGELPDEDKDNLLPVIVLATHGRTKAVEQIIGKVDEYFGARPRIIDLEPSPIYACDECAVLSDPAGGFQRWRQFISAQNMAVPTALMPPGAPSRDVVRQVIMLENELGQVVIRSRDPSSDLPLLTSILSAVDSVNNLLVVLDFGYVRSRTKARAVEAATVINALREIDDNTRIVVLGSSYPKSAAAYDDAAAALEIEERALHAALGGDSVALYGDYGSIHPDPVEPMQSRFVPRIDYPLPDAWVFRRVRADQGGYEKCAELITGLVDWDQSLVGKLWGADKIFKAAGGDLTSMGTPGPWIAVRVNIHLWQQLHYRDIGAMVDDQEGIFG